MKIVNNVNSCPTRGMAAGFIGALALGFAFTAPVQAHDALPTDEASVTVELATGPTPNLPAATPTPSPTPIASPQDCETRGGEPRDCTLSENFKKCIANADDAHRQCMKEADWWASRAACDAGLVLDLIACKAAAIKEILF